MGQRQFKATNLRERFHCRFKFDWVIFQKYQHANSIVQGCSATETFPIFYERE